MNILLIHPHDIFSPEEPWTVRIRRLAVEFTKRGHAVRLVYFPLQFTDAEPRQYEGVRCLPLSRRVGIRPLLHNIKRIRNLAAWADVIHVQKCFYHAAIPAVLAALFQGKPLHYDWDDWEIKIFRDAARQPWFVGLFLATLERWLPVLSDTVSVASQRLREECLKYGVPAERIFSAPVGADLEQFHPAISGARVREKYHIAEPLIMYMGQLHSGQYAELFIRAARVILNQTTRVCFMIVGGGHRLDHLKKIAQDLDLGANLIFTGSVPHTETPVYLAAADIGVACFEDNEITRCKSPLKIVEYLASGKPIVASNVGEVKRLLGGAGVVVPAGDPGELAAGIMRLLEDEPLRNLLRIKSRERAERIYNWGTTAATLLQAYAMHCRGRPRVPAPGTALCP